MTPEAARDVALEVAALASEAARQGWGRAGRVWAKEAATDLVTEWDQRIEELIGAELARRAPGVAILGEELGARAEGGRDQGRWVVDPIDGTVNFAHGLPIFGVSIAYELDGQPVAGVISAPVLGWTFAAARGAGATRDGEPIRVSDTAELARAMLVTGFPYDRRESPVNNFDAWTHMQRTAGAVRRLGAASLDLCFVACGWLDGYWEIKMKPWDVAAGACIVREAGGTVTALDGGPYTTATADIAASNGRIHEAMLRELAASESRSSDRSR